MRVFFTAISCLVGSISFCQSKQSTIFFDYNKFDLTPAAIKTLDSLSAVHPAQIKLFGFCDAIGENAYNDNLSFQRIIAVKQYLLNKNILEKDFINEKGFGKRKPINDNADNFKRSLNRRVDIEYEKVEQPTTTIVQDKTVNEVKNLETRITDTTTKQGTTIALPNLNFVGGRHILLVTSSPYLAELLDVLKKYPILNIEIQGHICCEYTEADGYDFDTRSYTLSTNRAKAIYDFLVENGIEAQRLSYKGFGSKYPKVYPEKDESDRIANRRVEIKILSK